MVSGDEATALRADRRLRARHNAALTPRPPRLDEPSEWPGSVQLCRAEVAHRLSSRRIRRERYSSPRTGLPTLPDRSSAPW